MKCYIDFEANGGKYPKEIISIGATLENGEEFDSLVRPHHPLDSRISKLTKIKWKNLEYADDICLVVRNLFIWIKEEQRVTVDEFVVFGTQDKVFLEATIKECIDARTIESLNYIKEHLVDVSKNVAKFFGRESIQLRSAYATIQGFVDEIAANPHCSLNDAAMLRSVDLFMRDSKLPDDVEIITFQKENKNFWTKSLRAIPSDFIYNRKYTITFTATRGTRIRTYNNVREALSLIHNKQFKNNSEKLETMDLLLDAIVEGKEINGWKFMRIMPRRDNDD